MKTIFLTGALLMGTALFADAATDPPVPSAAPSASGSFTLTGNFETGPRVRWDVVAGGNGHYYQAVIPPAGVDFIAAQAYAESKGGYLATITSKEENLFVFNLIKDAKYWTNGSYYSSGPTLGGFKKPGVTAPNDGWLWRNNEGSFTYTNWSPGQPDNDRGVENRLHYYADGLNNPQSTWNDAPGAMDIHSFVMEFGAPVLLAAALPPPPPPVSLSILIPAMLVMLILMAAVIFNARNNDARTED